MKVIFLKDCGIYKKGDVVDVARAKGEQYIVSKFAKAFDEVDVPQGEDNLSDAVIDALVEAGFETIKKVESASDEDLLAIKGIGNATLKQIREQ